MIAQTGPRKLQINPVSVFNQQLWRETGGVSACLSLALQVNYSSPAECRKLGDETEIKKYLMMGQVAFQLSLDSSKSSF